MGKNKYESHVLPNLGKIKTWAEAGATSKDIAKKLRVSYSAFRGYIASAEKGDERYIALMDTFARACVIPDDEIETALFTRAKGIEYEEKTYETKWDKVVEEFVEVCTKRVTKFIPPDPTSAMFWLTNRRPEKWSYKPKEGEEEESAGGVVMLAPVMERPEPPEAASDGGDGDG